MRVFRDKHIKYFSFFVIIYSILLMGAALWFCQSQMTAIKCMLGEHDTAIVSSLLEQGVSDKVIATAVFNTEVSIDGIELLNYLGVGENTISNSLPYFSKFQYNSWIKTGLFCTVFILILLVGIFAFLWIRNRLFQQSSKIIGNYINNDYSCHLPQNSEGEIFHLFASVEQLATMLQSQKETEHKTKEFLKNTISDISHQLKTPLAALFHKLLFGMMISYRWGDPWVIPWTELGIIVLIMLFSIIFAVYRPVKRLQKMSIVENISAQ